MTRIMLPSLPAWLDRHALQQVWDVNAARGAPGARGGVGQSQRGAVKKEVGGTEALRGRHERIMRNRGKSQQSRGDKVTRALGKVALRRDMRSQ